MFRQALRDRWWLAAETFRISPTLAVAALALILLGTALPLAATVATGQLIGAIPAAVEGGLESPAGQRAVAALALVAATLVARRLVEPIRSTIATALKHAVDQRMEARVMRAVGAPAGIAHLEDPAMLDRISTAQAVGTGQHTPGDAVFGLVERAHLWLWGLGAAAIVALFSLWLALLLLAAWLWATNTGRREFISGSMAAARTTRSLRRSGYLRDLGLQPEAAREVRVFGLGGFLIERFAAEWLRAMEPIWRERRLGNRALVVSALPVMVTQSLAYGLLGWAGARGDLTLGDLALYLGAVGGIGALAARGENDSKLEYGVAALPALREVETRLGGEPRPAPAPSATKPIRFESVSFRYPGQSSNVLDGLDLEIPAGRSLAIVGANGAGKTTLVKLLCGLYEPTAGRITGRRPLGVIFQDFVQYHLTARENVALGVHADPERLRAAAERAGVLALVEALPRGWNTILSRQYKGGVDLSGGEWQRLALARALYAAAGGADVLVLDEPTAHLDVRAEADLYDRFLEITAGLTTVLISHRFSTVRRAERIAVLEHGRVAELGGHAELLALGGRYATMFRLQAERFAGA